MIIFRYFVVLRSVRKILVDCGVFISSGNYTHFEIQTKIVVYRTHICAMLHALTTIKATEVADFKSNHFYHQKTFE